MTNNDILMLHAASLFKSLPETDEAIRSSEPVYIGTQAGEAHKAIYAQVEENRANAHTATRPGFHSFTIRLFTDGHEIASMFRPNELTLENLTKTMLEIPVILNIAVTTENDAQTNATSAGDEYKVKMLERMLAHETKPSIIHYGANLQHAAPDTKPLTIDAGGIRALIAYYKSHTTNLD